MKKVLIITYYWPPAGGSGVQRWLKFVKYFRDFGIEPIVYTVENPDYIIADESLLSDIPKNLTVLKQAMWDPNRVLRKFNNKNREGAGFLNSKPSFFGRILHFVRANFFIPDARKFWIGPSVDFLEKYLKDHPTDAIISTGPPHSTHLIAMRLKDRLKIPWISDFRDPWTEIDYFHQLPLTKRALKKHVALEKAVLRCSDAVIVVGETMRKKYAEHNSQVLTITNGYDVLETTQAVSLNKKFSLVHVGLMNADRNPEILWKVLSEILAEDRTFRSDFELKLIGKVDPIVHENINKFRLNSYVDIRDYIPHDKVLAEQMKAQVLLLLVNNVPSAKGILTGKLFEYLRSGRPILAVAPIDGDLAAVVNECNAGSVIDFDDMLQLKKTILEYYTLFKKGQLKFDTKRIEQYHRKALTEQVSKLINRVIE